MNFLLKIFFFLGFCLTSNVSGFTSLGNNLKSVSTTSGSTMQKMIKNAQDSTSNVDNNNNILRTSEPNDQYNNVNDSSRRSMMLSGVTTILGGSMALLSSPTPAYAKKRLELDECLYLILRVREATMQEARLIKSGKFKDVQRANVKLAIKFILNNYRLADTFIAASAYLDDNTKRIQANDIGNNAVQNLYTILEYFDSSDVQNIKVGSTSGMGGGKEELVLKGLDSAKKSIEEFITYFPQATVDTVTARIKEENELNRKEWDPSLGDVINPSPTD